MNYIVFQNKNLSSFIHHEANVETCIPTLATSYNDIRKKFIIITK